MIRSVNDTNVWVAGINWDRGAGFQIRRHWEAGRFRHVISAEILYDSTEKRSRTCTRWGLQDTNALSEWLQP